jgi:hypothetical protein
MGEKVKMPIECIESGFVIETIDDAKHIKYNAMKTIPFFLIIILSLFPSFSFSGEGACLQGNCINGQGRKIYSDGKIHDGLLRK